jgi:hypothetical protein
MPDQGEREMASGEASIARAAAAGDETSQRGRWKRETYILVGKQRP